MYGTELKKDIDLIDVLISKFKAAYPNHPKLPSFNAKLTQLKEIIPKLWDPNTYLGSVVNIRPMQFLMTNVVTAVGLAQQIIDEVLSEATQQVIGESFRKLNALKDELKQNQDGLIFKYNSPPFLVAYDASRTEFKEQVELCFTTIIVAKMIDEYQLYGYIPIMIQAQNDNNQFPFKINPENILAEKNISLIEPIEGKATIGLTNNKTAFITKGYNINQLNLMINWYQKFSRLKDKVEDKELPTTNIIDEFSDNLLPTVNLLQGAVKDVEPLEASDIANILRSELSLERDPFDSVITKFCNIHFSDDMLNKYKKDLIKNRKIKEKLGEYIKAFSRSGESLSGQSYRSFDNFKNVSDNNNNDNSEMAVKLDISRLKRLGVDPEVIDITVANFNHLGFVHKHHLDWAKTIEDAYGIHLENHEINFQIKPLGANLLVRVYSNVPDVCFDGSSERRRNLIRPSLITPLNQREPSMVLTFDFIVSEDYLNITFHQAAGYVTQYAPAFIYNLVLDGLHDPTLSSSYKISEVIEFLGAFYLFLLEKLQKKLISDDLLIKLINHYCVKIEKALPDKYFIALDEMVNRDLYAVGSYLFKMFKEADINEFKINNISLSASQSLNIEKFKDSPETWDNNDIKHWRELIFSLKQIYGDSFNINFQDIENALELIGKPKESSSSALEFLKSTCIYVNSFLKSLRNLKVIKSLNLSGNKTFTQRDFEDIFKICPDLQVVDISSTMVTSVRYLSKSQIFQINLSECKKLDSIDIHANELALNLEGCDGLDLHQISLYANKYTVLQIPSHYRKTLAHALNVLSQRYVIHNDIEIFLKDFQLFTAHYRLFCDQKFTAGTQFLRNELISEWVKFIDPVLQAIRPVSFIVEYYRILMPEIAFAMQLVLSLDESLFMQMCQNGISSNDWLTIALSIVVESSNNKDLMVLLMNNGADPFKRVTLGSEVKPIKNISIGNISAFERGVLKSDLSIIKLFLTPQRYNAGDIILHIGKHIHIEVILYSALGYALEKQNYPMINYLFFIIRANILANAPLQGRLLQHAAFMDKFIFVTLMVDHQKDYKKLLINLPVESQFIDLKLNVPDMVLSLFLCSLELLRKKYNVLFDVDLHAKQIKNINFKSDDDTNFNFSKIQVMDDYQVQNMLASNLLLVTFEKLIHQQQVPYTILLYKKCVTSLSLQDNNYIDLFLLAAKLNCWQLVHEVLLNNPDKISLSTFNEALITASSHKDLSTYLTLSQFKPLFITSETELLQSQFADLCQAIKMNNTHLVALLLKVYPHFALEGKEDEINLHQISQNEKANEDIIQLIGFAFKQFDKASTVHPKLLSGNDPANRNSTWKSVPLSTITTLEDAILDPSTLQTSIFQNSKVI